MRLFDPSVPFMCVAWLASLLWRLFLSGPLVRIKPNERARQAAFSVSSPSSTNPDHSYKGRKGGDLFGSGGLIRPDCWTSKHLGLRRQCDKINLLRRLENKSSLRPILRSSVFSEDFL